MFVVVYTLNMCISVFMTCSISYSLYDTVMDPQNVYMCVCVCVCVCVYVCVYVCVCVFV